MKNSKKTTRKRTGARSQKAAPLSINPAVRPSKMARRDPFHAREAERYENPLPSREYILATLKEQGVPVYDVNGDQEPEAVHQDVRRALELAKTDKAA